MKPETIAIVGWIFAALQFIFNIAIGVIAWQWKRAESRRDEDRKTLQQGQADLSREMAHQAEMRQHVCQARHQDLDARCASRLQMDHEREISSTVKFAEALRQITEKHATREELQDALGEIRGEFRRVFTRLDAMGNDQASRLSALEERTGGLGGQIEALTRKLEGAPHGD